MVRDFRDTFIGSTRKPKMAVCGVNIGRFKSVEKNILS